MTMSKLAQELKSKIAESVGTYQPASAGQKRFVMKHFDADNQPTMAPGFTGNKDRAGNNVDTVYKGVTKTAPRPGHGYAAAPSDEDEKVYEGKTYRHGDNSKHKSGATVKAFLNKKRKKDSRRLQEGQLDELSKKTLGSYVVKSSNDLGVRGLRIGTNQAQRDTVGAAIGQSDFGHKTKQDLRHSVEVASELINRKERFAAGKRTTGISRAVSRLASNKYPSNISTQGKRGGKAIRNWISKTESVDIPENEQILELIVDITEATSKEEVRALKGKIVHRQFVGMVGTSGNQEHYCVQDQGGRKYHIFTNKELGPKGDKVDLFVKEYKKGGGILSVAKKNAAIQEAINESRGRGSLDNMRMVIDNDSPRDSHETYQEHHVAVKKLLGDINNHIDDRLARITAPRNEVVHQGNGDMTIEKRPGKAHWGHVGDMKQYRRTLEDMRDSMTQQGEYSLPAMQKAMKEELELNELIDDSNLSLADVRKKMMDANRVHQQGVVHKDKLIQDGAKKRLQQLAKMHAKLSANTNEEMDPEFEYTLDQIDQILDEE